MGVTVEEAPVTHHKKNGISTFPFTSFKERQSLFQAPEKCFLAFNGYGTIHEEFDIFM